MSESDPFRIILGLVLSISMLVLLSAVIMEIMSRYRWIAYAGAAVLAWTAADMMIHDLDTFYRTRWAPGGEAGFPTWAAYATPHRPGDPLPDHEMVVAEGECCERSRAEEAIDSPRPVETVIDVAPSYHLPLRAHDLLWLRAFRPIVMGQGLMRS